jgi:hypothetical protein
VLHVVIIFAGVVVRSQKGVGVLGGAVLGVRELLVRPCLRPIGGGVGEELHREDGCKVVQYRTWPRMRQSLL